MTGLLFAVLLAVAPPGGAAAAPEGIRWEGTFREARERARKEKRLLMIKPVVMITDDGCW